MNADIGPWLEAVLRAYLTACRRFRIERDADGLVNLLAALADPELRLHRFGELLAARTAEEAAWVLAYMHERVSRGDGRAQRVAAGLLDKGRLARVFPTDQLEVVAALLRERGHASAALFGRDPSRATDNDGVAPRPRSRSVIGSRWRVGPSA